MASIPADLDEVTPAWLNEHCDLGGPVADVHLERIAEGLGMISLIGRASLTYDEGAGPASIIVKLSSPVPELVDMAQTYGFYHREVSFYSEAAHLVPNVGQCFHAEVDEPGRASVVVLEDLGHLRMADQVAGCSADDALLAMEAAADLHARFWSNDALASLTWLPPGDNPMYLGAEAAYSEVFPLFEERYGSTISTNALVVAEALRTKSIPLMIMGASEPEQTLAHFDLRLDNLMFSDDLVYLLDWQLSARTVPTQDVAYFLGWSMQNDVRRELTPKLIERYHDKLIDNGITGFSLDRCTDLVRRSMLGVALMLAYGAVAVPATNDRGQALLDVGVDRAFATIDDMNCAELLPS